MIPFTITLKDRRHRILSKSVRSNQLGGGTFGCRGCGNFRPKIFFLFLIGVGPPIFHPWPPMMRGFVSFSLAFGSVSRSRYIAVAGVAEADVSLEIFSMSQSDGLAPMANSPDLYSENQGDDIAMKVAPSRGDASTWAQRSWTAFDETTDL